LSREKRQEIDIFKDYFEMVNPSGFKEFYYSTKYRCYFNPTVYPVFKRDIHNWFKDKDYYPESHLKNPKKDGVWYVKPNEGANGKGIIITDDVSSVDMKNAVYQKSIDNPLLYNGRKLDLRYFVAMTTYQGYLRTYLFFDNYVRLAPLPYDKKDLRPEVQLTNWDSYWIDFYDDLELRPKYTDDIMKSGLFPFSQHPLRDELTKNGLDLLIDFSEDVHKKLNNKPQRNLIQVFGIDVAVDKDMKIWLLETNNNTHPTVIDDKRMDTGWTAKRLTESVIEELIKPMENDTDIKLNNFKMVYEKQLKYNKWIFV